MDDLTFTVHAILWQMAASDLEQQRFCSFFIGEYNSRADEFSRYKWEPPAEESRWNTFPYEYGKRLMNISGAESIYTDWQALWPQSLTVLEG